MTFSIMFSNTYAYNRVAYDYTLSVTAGPNSKYPVEFYTGYATFTK